MTSYPIDKGAGRYAGNDPHVAKALQEVSRAISGIAALVAPTGVPLGFLAKITGVSGGHYAFSEAYVTTAGTPAILTGGRSGTTTVGFAVEQNNYTASLTNQFVWMTTTNDGLTVQGQQTPTYSFSIPGVQAATLTVPRGVLIPVTVAYNSGLDGTSTTVCAYKYDVTLLAGGGAVLINVAPLCGRETTFYGKRLKAVRGQAYYDSGGTITLWSVDEYPDVVACS